MGNLIRYSPNRAGMRELLRSREVDAMLEVRAHKVAGVAQSGFDSIRVHTGRVEVDVEQNESDSDRARVAVIARHPAALGLEAEHRILGSAIGAAG